MSERLAQIDEIRRRLPVSYAQAQEALEEAEGDIVGALVILERRQAQDLSVLIRRLSGSASRERALRWRIEIGGVTLGEGAVPAGQVPRWLRCLLLLLSLSKVVLEEEPKPTSTPTKEATSE